MQEDRWLWVYLRTIKARLCFMSMHIINLLPLITFKIHNDPWLPRVIITRGSDLTGEFPSAGSHSSLASSLFSAGSVSQLHGVSACANLPRPGVLLRCSSLHTWSVIVQHISVSTELIFLGVVLLRPSTLFFFSNYLSARFLQTNQVKIVLNDKHSHYSPNYLFKKLGTLFWPTSEFWNSSSTSLVSITSEISKLCSHCVQRSHVNFLPPFFCNSPWRGPLSPL